MLVQDFLLPVIFSQILLMLLSKLTFTNALPGTWLENLVCTWERFFMIVRLNLLFF